MSSDEQHRSSADPREPEKPERPEPASTEVPGAAEIPDTPDAPETTETESLGSAGDPASEDVAGEADAADEPVAAGASGASRPGPSRWLVLGSAALASAAFVVAAVFGVMWWVTATGDDTEIAQAREDVVRAAGNAVMASTELNYENPDAYFARQKRISTGKLREQIEQTERNYRQAIAEAKTKVVSTIQDVAVEELNVHEGKASALTTVRIKITQGERKATKTMRLRVEMTRVDADGKQVWKLSSIGKVPAVGPGG